MFAAERDVHNHELGEPTAHVSKVAIAALEKFIEEFVCLGDAQRSLGRPFIAADDRQQRILVRL